MKMLDTLLRNITLLSINGLLFGLIIGISISYFTNVKPVCIGETNIRVDQYCYPTPFLSAVTGMVAGSVMGVLVGILRIKSYEKKRSN